MFALQYERALRSLITECRAGHQKRAREWWRESLGEFLAAEKEKIKDFPKVPALQKAVKEAYSTISLIAGMLECKPDTLQMQESIRVAVSKL